MKEMGALSPFALFPIVKLLMIKSIQWRKLKFLLLTYMQFKHTFSTVPIFEIKLSWVTRSQFNKSNFICKSKLLNVALL
jgi:hypothetical protein